MYELQKLACMDSWTFLCCGISLPSPIQIFRWDVLRGFLLKDLNQLSCIPTHVRFLFRLYFFFIVPIYMHLGTCKAKKYFRIEKEIERILFWEHSFSFYFRFHIFFSWLKKLSHQINMNKPPCLSQSWHKVLRSAST